jgi:hypothetical protein
MWIKCDAIDCRNQSDLDLEALRDRLGADYRISNFVARSNCSRCGARWPNITPTDSATLPQSSSHFVAGQIFFIARRSSLSGSLNISIMFARASSLSSCVDMEAGRYFPTSAL